MNAEPAFVERTRPSLKLRSSCTCGAASDPKVAVAMTHLGGVKGKVAVLKVDTEVAVAVDVTKVWMTIDTDDVAVSPPPVPVMVIEVVVEGAALETATESKEDAVFPDGGVTMLGLNPPVTPDGIIAERVTGELKPPTDKTVTAIVAVPPGLITKLLGLADMLKIGEPVTVKMPLADDPVLPIAKIV